MALAVAGLMHGETKTPAIYYHQPWLRTLESMMDLIHQDPGVNILSIEPTLGLRYQGDFYGLLVANQIPAKYHWIIMRLNNMTSPTEYTGEVLSIIVPGYDFVEDNLVVFRTIFQSSF